MSSKTSQNCYRITLIGGKKKGRLRGSLGLFRLAVDDNTHDRIWSVLFDHVRRVDHVKLGCSVLPSESQDRQLVARTPQIRHLIALVGGNRQGRLRGSLGRSIADKTIDRIWSIFSTTSGGWIMSRLHYSSSQEHGWLQVLGRDASLSIHSQDHGH